MFVSPSGDYGPNHPPSLNGGASRRPPMRRLTTLLQRVKCLESRFKTRRPRGLAETRISDIAEQAGVSPGLILYYFDSKDRLLSEALTYANDQFYLRMSREIRRIDSARGQPRRP